MFSFSRRIVLMLSLFMLPIGPVAAGSAIVPFEPETVTAPTGLDAARIDRAVVEGFVIRGWRITEIDTRAGIIDAELPVRAHLGRVRARIEGRKGRRAQGQVSHSNSCARVQCPGKIDAAGRQRYLGQSNNSPCRRL